MGSKYDCWKWYVYNVVKSNRNNRGNSKGIGFFFLGGEGNFLKKSGEFRNNSKKVVNFGTIPKKWWISKQF
jgi:hypothetical protein